MPDSSIENLIRTAMDSIKAMVDVNTILGDPVQTQDGVVILPVSRVTFGFVAGGAEYEPGAPGAGGGQGGQPERLRQSVGLGGQSQGSSGLPFGGGSGAGVSLSPVCFVVVNRSDVRCVPVGDAALLDRLIDAAPHLVQQLRNALTRKPSVTSTVIQSPPQD